jgi:uncharacterized protein YecT (DUF1311 family)
MNIKKLAALAVAAMPLFAHADDKLLSKRFGACMDGSGGVTATMLNCVAAETQAQDKALNANYTMLLKRTAPSRKPSLQEAQRAWIKYRDLNCGFYADPDGGTSAGVDAASCVMQMTADRAKELGDLATQAAVR